MKTLRRISRHVVKAVSASAVLVAAALPVAFATSAGAATTGPTITCSQAGPTPVASPPYVCGALPYTAAGGTLTFYVFGSGFANDTGPASVTTTAPGVTGAVLESSTSVAEVTLYTSATTTPGYYPITITDDNGSATLATAFGVDPTASANGATPSSIAVGSTRLITVSGVGLTNSPITGTGVHTSGSTGLVITNAVATGGGTSLTFDATGYTVGTYQVTIGVVTFTLTVTGPTISAVTVASASGYITATNPASSQTVTLTGSGFEPGATVEVAGQALPTTFDTVGLSGPTVASNTSITFSATVPTTAGTVEQEGVTVINPDGTQITVANALGFFEAGAALSSNSATMTLTSNNLAPGANASVTITPGPGFNVTAGSTATLSVGSISFTGSVTPNSPIPGEDTISFYLPANLSTTVSAAIGAGVTQVPLANLSGLSVGTPLTFTDTGDVTNVLALNPGSSSVTVAPTANAHGVGTVVDFPITGSGAPTFTLTVGNGTQSASLSGIAVGSVPASTWQYLDTTGTLKSVTTGSFPIAPGTYTYEMSAPGANMGVGTKVAFVDTTSPYAGTNPDGITGTIVATSPDTATVRVTVAGSQAISTSVGTLAAATAGDTWINLSAGCGSVSAGEQLIIAADLNTLNGETVTVGATWNPASCTSGTPIPITAPLKYSHTGGEAVSTLMAGNVTSQAYDAVITNAAGVQDTVAFGTTAAPSFSLATAMVNGVTQAASASWAANATTISVTSGYIFAGQAVFDVTTGTFIGTVASYTPGTVTLTAGAAAASQGGTDLLEFGYRTVGNDAGLGGMTANLVIAGVFGDTTATHYVVTSTTPGVTFGSVTAINGSGTGTLAVPMSVAAGTPVNTNVQFTVVDLTGSGTASLPSTTVASSGLLIGVAPTITAVSAMPTLTSGESATVTVTGTGFDSAAVNSLLFYADAGNGAGAFDNGTPPSGPNTGVNAECTLVSSTTITCVVSVGDGAANGQHDIYLQNLEGGVATFANVLNVSMPTATTILPATGQSYMATSQSFVISGITGMTVSPTNLPNAYYSVFEAGGTDTSDGSASVSYYGPNAVTVTFTPGEQVVAGMYIVTLRDVTGTAAGDLYFEAPAVPTGLPLNVTNTGVSLASGTSTSFTINAANITNAGNLDQDGGLGTSGNNFPYLPAFMSGATVTSATPGITTSSLTVLPGIITGTVNVASTVGQGTYDLLVTNPDGSVGISTITVTPGPLVSSVNGTAVLTGSVSFLAGSQQTLTIVGSNFQQGLVVSTPTSGVATFGTATVNGAGTQVTVPVTFTNFSGPTPVTLDLVLTNPTTGGSVTVPAELVVNPSPTVTGTYYVPTFTSNTQIIINGTGFESGITATSSNSDYTVTAPTSTPTTVTLIVSTDANATTGTSSNITLTNPDGGTVTFALNGGPNPNTQPKKPVATRTVGPVWTGKVSTVRVVGKYFYGQPTVTSNAAGTKVGVSHDTGGILTLVVKTAKTTPRGVHTFTITFSNGDTTTVKYNQR